MNLIQWYYTKKHKGGLDLDLHEKHQATDFQLVHETTLLGAGDQYLPKSIRTNNAARILEVRNQLSLDTCVCTSGTAGKEPDEKCLLDEQVMAAYLTQRGEMSSSGTSLSAFQNALKNFGIPERIKSVNYNQSWDSFIKEKIPGGYSSNASKHKNSSFYFTRDINQILKELDNCRMGHTGGTWYSGYNPSQVSEPYLLKPNKGYSVGGHALLLVDYDTDYLGQKVFKILNSYGKEAYDNGYFYVTWDDLNAIFSAGVYFWSDMEKNVLGWLSSHQGKLVKEKNGPKIYFINGEQKRHIPSMAFLYTMRQANDFEVDEEDMLPQVSEGSEFTWEEIPQTERDKNPNLSQNP